KNMRQLRSSRSAGAATRRFDRVVAACTMTSQGCVLRYSRTACSFSRSSSAEEGANTSYVEASCSARFRPMNPDPPVMSMRIMQATGTEAGWRAKKPSIELPVYDSKMHLSSPPTPRVCAVVVTYNPSPSFVENVAAVSTQVDHIVVVDNGCSSETEVHLVGLESRLGCKVLRNHQNLGIAAALNIGVKYATEAGFDWVATLDQDSRVSDGFISLMLETYRQAPHPEKIAVVAPSYVDRETGARRKAVRASNGDVLITMSSGSMMPVSAI